MSNGTIYDPNANFQISRDRPSVHVITAGSNLTSLATQVPLVVPCVFPVREIICRLSYNLLASAPGLFYLTTNHPAIEADVVGSLGRFCIMSGGEHRYANDLTNKIHYILRQPLNCSGSYYLQLKQVYGSTLTSCDFILDMEFLG